MSNRGPTVSHCVAISLQLTARLDPVQLRDPLSGQARFPLEGPLSHKGGAGLDVRAVRVNQANRQDEIGHPGPLRPNMAPRYRRL